MFVYDYHPGAETLLSRHFSGPDSTLPINPDGSLMFPANPRPGMSGGLGARHRPGGLMPERLIWSYIIQLSSALRVVHSAGLACRVIDPSKILMIGNSRWYYSEPFDFQEWSISNFSCSLTINITSHSMKKLAFHSLLRWQGIILPILTTSRIHLSLRGWENGLFELRSERVNPFTAKLKKYILPTSQREMYKWCSED